MSHKPALVLCIRGLLSVFLSRAMETLSARINDHFGPDTSQVTDHGWAVSWFSNVPTITQQCIDAKKSGKKVVLIGHSFGATSILMVARALKDLKLNIDFAGPIDPAGQYDCSIPSNIGAGLSYYNTMVGQLGHGVVTPDKTWASHEDFKKVFPLVQGRYETHLQIAADPAVQDSMFDAVVKELS